MRKMEKFRSKNRRTHDGCKFPHSVFSAPENELSEKIVHTFRTPVQNEDEPKEKKSIAKIRLMVVEFTVYHLFCLIEIHI